MARPLWPVAVSKGSDEPGAHRVKRRNQPVLITDAAEDPEREIRRREIRYVRDDADPGALPRWRRYIVVQKPPLWGLWASLCVVGMVVLPWLAVILANDRPPRKPAAVPPPDRRIATRPALLRRPANTRSSTRTDRTPADYSHRLVRPAVPLPPGPPQTPGPPSGRQAGRPRTRLRPRSCPRPVAGSAGAGTTCSADAQTAPPGPSFTTTLGTVRGQCRGELGRGVHSGANQHPSLVEVGEAAGPRRAPSRGRYRRPPAAAARPTRRPRLSSAPRSAAARQGTYRPAGRDDAVEQRVARTGARVPRSGRAAIAASTSEGRKCMVGAAVAQHGPILAVGQHDDAAGRASAVRRTQSTADTGRGELGQPVVAGASVADDPDEVDRGAGPGQPGGGVGGRSAAGDADPGRRVRVDREWSTVDGEDVGDDVTDHRVIRPAVMRSAWAAAISAARAALRRMTSMLTSRLAPSVASWKWASRYGVTALPVIPSRARPARPSASTRSCRSGSSCSSTGSGLATTIAPGASPSVPVRAVPSAISSADVQRPVQVEAAVGEVEAGEAAGAVTDHRHAQRLQPLQRGTDVQDGLHSGADHQDRGTAERGQVGRLVVAVGRSRWTPPSPPVAKTVMPARAASGRRARHRGGAVGRPSPRRPPGPVPTASQPRRRWPDAVPAPSSRPTTTVAADHADRGRHRTVVADRLLDLRARPQGCAGGAGRAR